MSNTKLIIDKFNSLVDINKEYTKNELCAILKEVYKEVNKKKEKTKRQPSKYNLFVSENISKLKEENPDLNRQDLMRKVGELWKKQKEESSD